MKVWEEVEAADAARDRLAAAAPDMARVLIRLSKLACPFCRRDPGECSRTCEVDAALRKAGVR